MNINGLSSKIENLVIVELFLNYDIIFISELKCHYSFSLPGFTCIRSELIPGEMNRGGVAVLFKDYLWPSVYDVTKEKDQVWFRLRNAEGFIFGAVYIVPRDSPFFSNESFAIIHEHSCGTEDKVIILGDLNARMGNLDIFNDGQIDVSYQDNADPVSNANGRDVATLCQANSLKPVNHMKYRSKQFDGNLTFRKKDRWISQLDWSLVSNACIQNIVSFNILQTATLPSDHAPITLTLGKFTCTGNGLLLSASQLGTSVVPSTRSGRSPIAMQNINHSAFIQLLPSPENLWELTVDIDGICCEISQILYNTASVCKVHNITDGPAPAYASAMERWKKLIRDKDSKSLWQSINWKGEFESSPDAIVRPSDKDFCDFYEDLFQCVGQSTSDFCPTTDVYVPVLDAPISPSEVEECVKRLKSNKAAGVDGVAPGLMKLLTDEWLLLITFVFNLIFGKQYPLSWTIVKMFNIYKKGGRLQPTNYRGISILVAIAKLYDMVLATRFSLWFKPKYQQAGSQPGRGCEEQIFTVRLLIDIARKTRKPLYIVFVDYHKAYDKVNRVKLLQHLERRGCGSNFLRAIKGCYSQTSGCIGHEFFTSATGVRQGASTSCSLFTFYIEPTIDAIGSLGDDGWLKSLHGLLLMDDTVVLATSRKMMENKLQRLKNCIDELGMVMNPSKSMFMCTDNTDTNPFIVQDVTINHTETYVYLGTPIMCGSIAEQVQTHIAAKGKHVMKFQSFIRRNSDAPFQIKKRVWESALRASVFFSCETWLVKNLKSTVTICNGTLKNLLGVCTTSCNDLVLVESGEGGAPAHVARRQVNFLEKLTNRPAYKDSYLEWVVKKAIECRCPAGIVLLSRLRNQADPEATHLLMIQERIKASQSSRRLRYLSINPTLSVSPVYESHTPEHLRLAFTRLRLGSHRLRFEMGRWSRIPPEERLCPCGDVQNEAHLLLYCPFTKPDRDTLNISANNLIDLFTEPNIAELCYKILTIDNL